MRYRKKPVVIEAVQFNGTDYERVLELTGGDYFEMVDPEDRVDDPSIVAQVFDRLHSTWVGVHVDDWIIKGVQGEFYPCKPDIFDATYEPVKDGYMSPDDRLREFGSPS
jgi:hypothetical protein